MSKVLRMVGEWVMIIILGFMLAFVVQKTAFAVYTVDGQSMEPTLQNRDKVFVNRIPLYFDDLDRGDVVIFPNPVDGRNFVKRVIGLPGEEVAIRDGYVYINGEQLDESYVDTKTFGNMAPVVVKEDHVFVMGDNRKFGGSKDSRDPTIGQIPISKIIGKAHFVLFPHPHGIK